jgi:hypothetical protein
MTFSLKRQEAVPHSHKLLTQIIQLVMKRYWTLVQYLFASGSSKSPISFDEKRAKVLRLQK